MKHSLSLIAGIAFASSMFIVSAPQLRATTLAHLSLKQITSSAAIVAQAKCTAIESRWRDGEIWTVTSFRTEEIWKGNLSADFQIWMLGGRSGPVTSYVPGAPRFRPGEEAVLFLEPISSGDLSITAWGEGTFRIARDRLTGEVRVTQDTALMAAFDPATRRFSDSGIHDWPLKRLKSRVLRAEVETNEQRSRK